jgi:hypothetical protein
MPTELRFDDLDLREQPAMTTGKGGESELSSIPTNVCPSVTTDLNTSCGC